MSYDTWKARQPDEYRHDGQQPEPDTQTMTCRDCLAVVREGGSTTGIASGVSCEACFRWREQRDLVFDVRTIAQMKAAQRKGAA